MDEGYNFENPAFDEDDYYDIDDRLLMVPDETDQRVILNQSGAIDDLRVNSESLRLKPRKKTRLNIL